LTEFPKEIHCHSCISKGYKCGGAKVKRERLLQIQLETPKEDPMRDMRRLETKFGEQVFDAAYYELVRERTHVRQQGMTAGQKPTGTNPLLTIR